MMLFARFKLMRQVQRGCVFIKEGAHEVYFSI